MKKKISAILTSLALTTACMSASFIVPQQYEVLAAETSDIVGDESIGTYNDLTYKICSDDDSQYIEIIDCDEAATEVIIPEEINGLPVTYIGDNAFYSCEELVMVNMPDTITSTGVSIFEFCFKLKDVKLSENLTIINYDMFKSCIALEKITIPDNVKTINGNAFLDCENITEIIIPKNVENIEDFAFSDCSNLEKVYVTSKNVEFGDIVFTNGVKVPTLDNPNGGYIFIGTIYGYENSTAQEYAESNDIAFEILDEEPAVTTATTIVSETSTTTLTTAVSDTSTTDTSSLTNVSATTSLSVTSTSVSTGIKDILVFEKVDEDNDDEYDYAEIIYCSGEVPVINIPSKVDDLPVKSIDNAAFKGNQTLEKILIPNNIENIESYAFKDCINLSNITIINPECDICDSPDTIPEDAVIYAYDNSTAQEYALKYDREFVSLGEMPVFTTPVTTTVTTNTTTTTTSTTQTSTEATTTITTTATTTTKITTATTQTSATTSLTTVTTTTSQSTTTTTSTTLTTITTVATTTTTSVVTMSVYVGDANRDGKVNVSDAAFIARALATQNQDILPYYADVNEDNKVNVSDAATIARRLARKDGKHWTTIFIVVTKN